MWVTGFQRDGSQFQYLWRDRGEKKKIKSRTGNVYQFLYNKTHRCNMNKRYFRNYFNWEWDVPGVILPGRKLCFYSCEILWLITHHKNNLDRNLAVASGLSRSTNGFSLSSSFLIVIVNLASVQQPVAPSLLGEDTVHTHQSSHGRLPLGRRNCLCSPVNSGTIYNFTRCVVCKHHVKQRLA